jgi:hypothetical protein
MAGTSAQTAKTVVKHYYARPLHASQCIEVGADNQPLAVTLHSSYIPAQHLNKHGKEYSPKKPKSY